MNTDTEKNVNEAIDWLQQTGGSIQDFAVEQAPLYCRELIQWRIASSSVGIGLSILVLIVGVLTLRRLRRGWLTDSKVDGHFILGFIVSIALFAFSMVAAFSMAALIKSIVAPRLVIVEHLRSLK